MDWPTDMALKDKEISDLNLQGCKTEKIFQNFWFVHQNIETAK